MGPLRAGRVLKGGAVEHVQRLRREPGRGLMVWGSISLAQSLLKAGLVDEIQQGDGALAALGPSCRRQPCPAACRAVGEHWDSGRPGLRAGLRHGAVVAAAGAVVVGPVVVVDPVVVVVPVVVGPVVVVDAGRVVVDAAAEEEVLAWLARGRVNGLGWRAAGWEPPSPPADLLALDWVGHR